MALAGSKTLAPWGRTRWMAILTGLLACAIPSEAVEKASQQVSPFYGSFGYSIPIEVPPFHGIEPKLALAYSSEGRNGILGVGWTLTGFSTIERANSGRGTPRFNSSDIYLLDGQELVACVGGSTSPSCTSGGTHSTKIESYLKIRHDTTPSDTWTVWGNDGTRTIFSPLGIIGMAAKYAKAPIAITFGHGARHLKETGLSPSAVEAAIRSQIDDTLRIGQVEGSFWGRVGVSGQTIEYRAYPLPDRIHVGTYYPPRP